MFSRIHQKLGTAGFVISIIALIAALTGGAYAASGGLNKTQKKEVEKIAKKISKPGPAGATGPAGAGGSAGAKGDTGAKGANGANGTNGTNGGQGNPGAPGAPGSPGAPGPACPVGACFLPSEATETGIWGQTNGEIRKGATYFPISFNLPLEEEPEAVLVKKTENEVQGKCPGRGDDGIPLAEPGFLCVYEYMASNASFVSFQKFIFEDFFEEFENVAGVSPVGTLVGYDCSTEFCNVGGTWAVTAE